MGSFIGGTASSATDSVGSAVVYDLDDSELSTQVLDLMSSEGGYIITQPPIPESGSPEDIIKSAQDMDYSSVVVIPKGFEQSVLVDKNPAELEVYSTLTSLSVSSIGSAGGARFAEVFGEITSAALISAEVGGDATFIKNPVTVTETTTLGDKSSQIPLDVLVGFVTQQNLLLRQFRAKKPTKHLRHCLPHLFQEWLW